MNNSLFDLNLLQQWLNILRGEDVGSKKTLSLFDEFRSFLRLGILLTLYWLYIIILQRSCTGLILRYLINESGVYALLYSNGFLRLAIDFRDLWSIFTIIPKTIYIVIFDLKLIGSLAQIQALNVRYLIINLLAYIYLLHWLDQLDFRSNIKNLDLETQNPSYKVNKPLMLKSQLSSETPIIYSGYQEDRI